MRSAVRLSGLARPTLGLSRPSAGLLRPSVDHLTRPSRGAFKVRALSAQLAAADEPIYWLPSVAAAAGVRDPSWRVRTVVKQSEIEGAGSGRFVQEAVHEGALVSVKPVVEMASVERLCDVPADRVITFNGADEVEKFVALAMEEGDYSRATVLHQLENFVWGLDENRACLNHTAWCMNHGEPHVGETVVKSFTTLADGREAVVGRAARALPAGSELLNSYRDFVIPAWYADYCRAHAISDVRSVVLRVVDGTPHANDPPRLPGGRIGAAAAGGAGRLRAAPDAQTRERWAQVQSKVQQRGRA